MLTVHEKLYAGFGCRRGCSADHLHQLLTHHLERLGGSLGSLSGLASMTRKAQEPGLLELADRLGLPLIVLENKDVAPFVHRLTHRSPRTFALTGCWGVAESSALALATRVEGSARLRLPRVATAEATLALASRA